MFISVLINMPANLNINDKKCNNVYFKSRIPKGVFYDAKDIPRLRCAKCKRLMMSKDEEHMLMYGVNSLTNEDIIEKIPAEMKKKSPYGVYFVKELLFEKGLGNLKKFYYENNSNKIKGQSASQSKQIKKIIKKVFSIVNCDDEPLLPLDKIIRNLMKIKSEYPIETEEFIEILASYHKKHPERSLTEILTDKELYNYHELLKETQHKEYMNLSMKHFSNMLKTVKSLSEDKVADLDKLNESAYDVAKKKSMSDVLRKALIENVYSKYLDSLPNGVIKQVLSQQINVIPLEHASGDYIFCKASKIKNINDKRIINFINYPLKNTFEHVTAKSMGGENNVSNGIYMCSQCNHERGTLPYPFLMKIYFDFFDNIQSQVSRLTTFIKKGTLIGYDTYPQDIKNKIKSICGKDINIDRFLKDQKSMLNKRIIENTEIINEEETILKQKIQQSKDLKQKIDKLMKSRRSSLSDIKQLTEDLNSRKKQLTHDQKVIDKF